MSRVISTQALMFEDWRLTVDHHYGGLSAFQDVTTARFLLEQLRACISDDDAMRETLADNPAYLFKWVEETQEDRKTIEKGIVELSEWLKEK